MTGFRTQAKQMTSPTHDWWCKFPAMVVFFGAKKKDVFSSNEFAYTSVDSNLSMQEALRTDLMVSQFLMGTPNPLLLPLALFILLLFQELRAIGLWDGWQKNRGSTLVEARDFYFKHVQTGSDHSWGPPSLLYNGYQLCFGGKAAGALRWPSPHLAPRLKKE